MQPCKPDDTGSKISNHIHSDSDMMMTKGDNYFNNCELNINVRNISNVSKKQNCQFVTDEEE